MSEIEKIKFSKKPAVIASILLLLALLSWPYGFYTFLKIVITAVAAYYAYYIYENKLTDTLSFWFWGLIFIAILFNPIFPIYLNRGVWGILDILTAVFFAGMVLKNRK